MALFFRRVEVLQGLEMQGIKQKPQLTAAFQPSKRCAVFAVLLTHSNLMRPKKSKSQEKQRDAVTYDWCQFPASNQSLEWHLPQKSHVAWPCSVYNVHKAKKCLKDPASISTHLKIFEKEVFLKRSNSHQDAQKKFQTRPRPTWEPKRRKQCNKMHQIIADIRFFDELKETDQRIAHCHPRHVQAML